MSARDECMPPRRGASPERMREITRARVASKRTTATEREPERVARPPTRRLPVDGRDAGFLRSYWDATLQAFADRALDRPMKEILAFAASVSRSSSSEGYVGPRAVRYVIHRRLTWPQPVGPDDLLTKLTAQALLNPERDIEPPKLWQRDDASGDQLVRADRVGCACGSSVGRRAGLGT